jgi:hypothetical protein
LVALLVVGMLTVAQPDPKPAQAGPVLRVLTWPFRAPVNAVRRAKARKCHGHEQTHTATSCHGKTSSARCGG